MKELVCPVCFNELKSDGKTYKCENNHCFDLSKYSVLNLALSNKSSKKRHGDDKNMVLARKNFLDMGYYEPVKNAVVNLAQKYCKDTKTLLDAGCGEGYYTTAVSKSVNAKNIYGIDISKDALRYFKKRNENALPIVASIFKMPLKESSIDLCLNMFTPNAFDEIKRVLKKDGYLIKTKVLKNHLFELKSVVYDNPYYNDEESDEIDGFLIKEEIVTDYKASIKGDDVKNLFLMTPYYYKTSEKDQKKLDEIDGLFVTISVKTKIYRKM